MKPKKDRVADEYTAYEQGLSAELIAESLALQNAARRYAVWFLLRARKKAEYDEDNKEVLLTNSMIGLAACSISGLMAEHEELEQDTLDEILLNVRSLVLRVHESVRSDIQFSEGREHDKGDEEAG